MKHLLIGGVLPCGADPHTTPHTTSRGEVLQRSRCLECRHVAEHGLKAAVRRGLPAQDLHRAFDQLGIPSGPLAWRMGRLEGITEAMRLLYDGGAP